MKTFWLILTFLSLLPVAYAENSFYSVQISTTSNYEDALHRYSKLKSHPNTRIEMINNSYAVRLGAYRSRTEALPLLNQLKKIHADALIINCYIVESRIKQSSNLDIQTLGEVSESASVKAPLKKITTTSPPSLSLPSPAKADKKPAVNPSLQTPEFSTPTAVAPENPEDYFKSGMQSYYDRRYELAISSLSHYLSLVPKSRQRVSAMMILGKSLDEMKRPRAALSLFGRLIEEYPDSPEAALSIVAMADIGLAQPGLKYPIGMKGSEYVMDPVFGYDVSLSKNIPRSTIEYVYYQKGRALWNKGQYIEAYRLMSHLLKEFPKTLYRNHIIQSLKDGALTLIDRYQQAGDHLSAANIFLQGRKSGAIGSEDTPVILKVSLSLAHLGLYDEARELLSSLTNNAAVSLPHSEIDNTLAEIDALRSGNVLSRSKDIEKWELFESGRSYLRRDNLPLAEQTLTTLKNSEDGPFWSKVSDYALEEGKWSQKYLGQGDKK